MKKAKKKEGENKKNVEIRIVKTITKCGVLELWQSLIPMFRN